MAGNTHFVRLGIRRFIIFDGPQPMLNTARVLYRCTYAQARVRLQSTVCGTVSMQGAYGTARRIGVFYLLAALLATVRTYCNGSSKNKRQFLLKK